jgi:hypothetical protein
MMTVCRAPHRIAALHRLFGRGHAAAIGCIRPDSDGEHSLKNSSRKTHQKPSMRESRMASVLEGHTDIGAEFCAGALCTIKPEIWVDSGTDSGV